MFKVRIKNFQQADEVRQFEKGKLEIVKIGDVDIGKFTLEPGWRWSKHIKPVVQTDWCEVEHFQYLLSGHLRIMTTDGEESDIAPGEVLFLPPGHDAWVSGDETVVLIDWMGAVNYAKKAKDASSS